MPTQFCLTVRFLQPYSHGRGNSEDPEWPPSPLRMFQALVAAAAARWNERMRLEYAAPALRWLEALDTPTMVAAIGLRSNVKYRLYVPDNVADKVAKSWASGREGTIADYRFEKDVRATHLKGEAVHYLFPLIDGECPHFEVLAAAARSITHLGWGVDMVAANASLISEEETANLSGERWRPADDSSATGYRVPIKGTLRALIDNHQAFLNRYRSDGPQPAPPLSAFRVVGYRRATDPATRLYAAFSILKPDASGNQAFDTPRRTRDVAAWLRHATHLACEGWPFGDIAAFVHGHDEEGKQLKGEGADRRFMYLPLPTINHKLNRVETIRRVLVTAPANCKDQLDWVRRRLPGQELQNLDGQPVGLLNLLPTSDWVLKQYVGEAQVWSTVTPVTLPGYDDPKGLRKKLDNHPTAEEQKLLLERLHRRIDGLLRKAFLQAGLAPELVASIQDEDLEWRQVGFRAGVDLANRFLRPDNLTGRQYHVRVRFPQPFHGPLAVGAGRYRGLGVFVAEDVR